MAVVLPRCTLSSTTSSTTRRRRSDTNQRRGGVHKARRNGEEAGEDENVTTTVSAVIEDGDVKKKKKRRRRRKKKSNGDGDGGGVEEKDERGKDDGEVEEDAKQKRSEELEAKRIEAVNKREEAEARLRELRERQRSAAAAAAAAAATVSTAVDASSTVSLMRSIRLRVDAAVDRANVAQTATREAAHRAKTNAATASQRGDVDEALNIDMHVVDVDAAAAEAHEDVALNERELEALHAIATDVAAATDAAEEDEAAAKSANVFQLRGQEREATSLARSIESRQCNATSAAQRARGIPKRDVHWDDTLTSIRARLDALQATISASAAETHVQKLSTIGTPPPTMHAFTHTRNDDDDSSTADNSSQSSNTDDASAVT